MASSMAPGWCRISRIRIPPNTLWTKQYNLYSKIDTEAPRYLGFEKLVGRPRQPQCRGDPVHRRRAVRRQQSRRGTNPDIGRHHDRPAQHPLADRGVLLEGRQRHAAAAGARIGFSTCMTTSTKSAPTDRPSSTPSMRSSAISASSFPAASPRRSTASSPAIST